MLVITRILRGIVEERGPDDAVASAVRLYLHQPTPAALSRLRAACTASERVAIDAAVGPAGIGTPLGSMLDESWREGLDEHLLAARLSDGCAIDCWGLTLRTDDLLADMVDVDATLRGGVMQCAKRQMAVLHRG